MPKKLPAGFKKYEKSGTDKKTDSKMPMSEKSMREMARDRKSMKRGK